MVRQPGKIRTLIGTLGVKQLEAVKEATTRVFELVNIVRTMLCGLQGGLLRTSAMSRFKN
jgi:hypothetical protein